MSVYNDKLFALCATDCDIKLLTNEDDLSVVLDSISNQRKNRNDKTVSYGLRKGQMVEIIDYIAQHNQNNKFCSIKILNYQQVKAFFDQHVYLCKTAALMPVASDAWPYVISVMDPFDRLAFAKDKAYVDYIKSLRVEDLVEVKGEIFNLSIMQQSIDFGQVQQKYYECVVKFIGPVQEVSQSGYCFGLELLTFKLGYSPQSEHIKDYVKNYLVCDPNCAFLLPPNSIRKQSFHSSKNKQIKETAEKFSPLNLINGFICGATNTIKGGVKKLNGKHSNSVEPSDSNNNRPKRPLTPELAERPMSQQVKFPPSVSSPNLAKQDSGSSTASSSRHFDVSVLDNSEYAAKFVENHERNMERNHEQERVGARGSSSSQNSSASGTVKQAPRARKKSTTTYSSTVSSSIKPSTILRLDDRDLVVIDNNDIKESTRHLDDPIIVLDPPNVAITPSPTDNYDDLMTVLGSEWPEIHQSCMLNSDRKSTGSYKPDRSRSMNPMNHIANSKPKREVVTFDLTLDGKRGYKKGAPCYDNIGTQTAISPTEEPLIPSQFSEIPGTSIGIGSMVEVSTEVTDNLYGVIRWIGERPNQVNGSSASKGPELIVGVELEDENIERQLRTSDGMFENQRYFKCPKKRSLFVHPSQCSKDRRFLEDSKASSTASYKSSNDAKMTFGAVDCPIVRGSVAPMKYENLEDLEATCGKFKGIQGHHNSCYLDATLFAMFAFTSVFDSLLFRPREPEDIEAYEEVQIVLREEIVNPLRKNLFVRADRVMKLRHLLDQLSSVKGLTNEEKDPEEFLNSLLAQIMRAEPFLKLSSGLDAFHYQLFIEKDEKLTFPSVQHLFEQSFLTSDIKLKEVPSCLIIQMPRFGKQFKMYPRIHPSQVLDVTDIIEDSPRQCIVCGKLAEYECKECFGQVVSAGLESISFCKQCLDTAHQHHKRVSHVPKQLGVPHDFKIMADHCPVPRLFMELFAVLCIETSHYVAFVKAGSGDAPWVFFDSMADRKGEKNGYNIPELTAVPDLPDWLSEEGARALNESAVNDKLLPEHAKRLLCDAYLCFYVSKDVAMYR